MFPLASDIQRLDMEVHHADTAAEIINGLLTHEVTFRETVGSSGMYPPKKHSRYALLTKIFVGGYIPPCPSIISIFYMMFTSIKDKKIAMGTT